MRPLLVLVLSLLFVALPGLRAELTLRTVTEMIGDASEVTVLVGPETVRIQTADGDALLRSRDNLLITLDPETKTFTEIDLRDLAASLPPPPTSGRPKLKRTGRTDTIQTFSCFEVVLTYPDGQRDELWLTRDGPTLNELFNAYGGDESILQQQLNQSYAPWLRADPDLAQTYPVRQTAFAPNGEMLYRTELRGFSRHPIDPAQFAIPEGYSKAELPALVSPDQAETLQSKSRALEDQADRLERNLNQ